MKWTKTKIENAIILALCAAFLIFFNLKNGGDSSGGDGFEIITSTTPAMIEEMAYAIKNHRSVAITAWKPHWMNAKLPIKYLKDPESVFGGPEDIHTVARKGFEEDYPEIARPTTSIRCRLSAMKPTATTTKPPGSGSGKIRNWRQRS